MSYEVLKKFYYMGRAKYEAEYERRKNEISCISFDIEIKENPMFFLYTPEIVILLNNILATNIKIERLKNLLPGVAYACYSKNCLVDEIMMTNDLEGIRSTRKEILSIIESDSDDKLKRFEGMVTKYMVLLDTESWEISLDTCEELGQLYDDIVFNEIEDKNKPDGAIFRKELACVMSSTQQVKHEGILPEKKIITYMEKTLNILNGTELPLLIRVAITHYLIGYIHPFYDGNGRLSRFVSSYMIQKELNDLIPLRLSGAIKASKSEYYKAFDTCNDRKNKGDITPFILMFLTMIDNASNHVKKRLEEGAEALGFYSALIEKIENQDENIVVFFLIQNRLFDNEAFNISSIAELLGCSYGKAREVVNRLIERGMPIERQRIGRSYQIHIELDSLVEYLESNV